MSQSSAVSLYFHIPFCTRKCDYCHFYVIPNRLSYHDQLMEGLALEWERCLPLLATKQIQTLYFGGGTPSLLGPEKVGKILKRIKTSVPFSSKAPEITLEVNPENVTLELMQGYADVGVNRVSIGVQTLDDSLLKLLGRTHAAQQALHSIQTTLIAGISNISIDLMFDLPRQTADHWRHTLDEVAELPIKHLSLYNLTIEPHTVFFKKQHEIRSQLPNEETSTVMYELAQEKLQAAGFKQYEISAFAKEGYASSHNQGYWTGRWFLGFGPSAFSYWEGKRFRNTANLSKYHQALQTKKSPVDFEEGLDPLAKTKELLVIRLRMIEGCDLSLFQHHHGELDHATKETLKELVDQGFLTQKDQRICLSKKGILFYDHLATELI